MKELDQAAFIGGQFMFMRWQPIQDRLSGPRSPMHRRPNPVSFVRWGGWSR